MTQHKGQSGSTGSSTPTGLGVHLEIDLGILRNLVGELKDALTEGGDKAFDMVNGAVEKISSKIEQYKQAAYEQGTQSDAGKVYDEAVEALQKAAQWGSDAAKKLCKEIGIDTTTGSSPKKTPNRRGSPRK